MKINLVIGCGSLKPKNRNGIRSSLFLVFFLIMACASHTVLAQEPSGETPPPPARLKLSIQYGKNGPIQEFQLTSGQSVFVQTGKPQSPSSVLNPQEVKSQEAYNQQLSSISTQISDKITQIQQKQKDLDNEVYLVYKAPLDIERQSLEHDLKLLEQQRDQLQSQHTAKEAQKPVQPPSPLPTAVSGMTLIPFVAGDSVSLVMETQGSSSNKEQKTIQVPANEWVQIFSAEKGQGLDIWAKVTPTEITP